MAKRKDRSPLPPATTLTLHLGDDSRAHLERCRQLLQDVNCGDTDLSLGRVVRIVLRRQLLSLLGERADWTRADCPITAEYLAVRAAQMRDEYTESVRRESRPVTDRDTGSGDGCPRPGKGGGT